MKASKQHALLVITSIAAGQKEALEKLFSRMVDEQDVETNQWVPFASLTTIHFARWFILPASTDVKGRPIPDQLVFSTNYDGPLDAHLAQLVDVAGESGLDEIYQHCVDYPAQPTRDNRLAYLRAHRVNYSAFYVGTVGRTVAQIRRENELRDAIQGFLDDSGGWDARAPADVRKAIQEFVFVTNKERFAWAQTPPPPQLTPWVRFIKTSFLWIVIVLIALLALLLVLGMIPFWGFLGVLGLLLILVVLALIVLRIKEERDPQVALGYSCPAVQDLIAREDLIVQNQMSAINNMKAGWFRFFVERLVQAVVNFAARYFANEGNLGGIPSIHFARWALIDNGRRLLFMSNFDGSWENYLGDFVDKAASGLTAVWSNTVLKKRADGFPKTKWLFREGGARDEQRFKAYARASQIVTNVWYSAYKELSVQNINNNSAIRAGLYGDPSPEEIAAWLHRF